MSLNNYDKRKQAFAPIANIFAELRANNVRFHHNGWSISLPPVRYSDSYKFQIGYGYEVTITLRSSVEKTFKVSEGESYSKKTYRYFNYDELIRFISNIVKTHGVQKSSKAQKRKKKKAKKKADLDSIALGCGCLIYILILFLFFIAFILYA